MAVRKFFALFAAAALPLACSDKSPTQPVSMEASSASLQTASAAGRPSTRPLASRELPPNGMIGTWGGTHLTITVGAASTILSYDCAHGTIDQPFVTDQSGKFDLVGTHTPESPGPVHPGESNTHPARYTGAVDGKTMTFSVTETDLGQTFGPFVLTLGTAGRIVKCL